MSTKRDLPPSESHSSSKRQKNHPSSTIHHPSSTIHEIQHEKAIHHQSIKYQRPLHNDPLPLRSISDKKLKSALRQTERQFRHSVKLAAQSEVLLPSSSGYLIPETPLEKTFKLSQSTLQSNVALQVSKYSFNLDLPLETGPHSGVFSRNGRSLLITSHFGTMSVLRWKSSTLQFTQPLSDIIHASTFLHNEQFLALAQKKYVYLYDEKGLEIHCIKSHLHPLSLLFLPYHFLLVSGCKTGLLNYTDTSTGQLVSQLKTRSGGVYRMTQNSHSGVVYTGGEGGVVKLWSPTQQTALVSMLCHKGPITALSSDPSTGHYLATAGHGSHHASAPRHGGVVSLWDIRTYKRLYSYTTPTLPCSLSISQQGLLAVGHAGHVDIWGNVSDHSSTPSSTSSTSSTLSIKQHRPYMQHSFPSSIIHTTSFVPYEDVLGVGHRAGFSSLIIPGAGLANYDSYEVNPLETPSQRRETEVVALLNKVAPSMIALDVNFIGNVRPDAQGGGDKEEEGGRKEKEKHEKQGRRRGKNTGKKRYLRKQANVIDKKKLDYEEKVRTKKQQALEGGEGTKLVPRALQRFL